MNAEMRYSERIQPVGFGGAFSRQLRFLWASRRPLLLLAALLAILVIAGEPWADEPMMRLLAAWWVWIIFVGPIWAFVVFHNEGPSSRLYFWSQPTGRTTHSLARIAAGLVWLWLALAALIVAGWLMGLVDGDAGQLAQIGLAGWVNFFTGPLIGYLGISVLTLPSDYPIRWFFGIDLVFVLTIVALVEGLGLEGPVKTALEPLWNESWGLAVTMVGGLAGSVAELEQALRLAQNPAYTGSSGFDAAGLWWIATPLWILFFAGLVALIATRHPDTLPKWRGLGR